MDLATLEEIVKRHDEGEDRDIRFAGAVLFQSEREPKVAQGYGLANRSEVIPNTTRTRFGIASGCKIFTAVAICQLVQRGSLTFDTLLSELEIGQHTFDSGVTVHHLLTHTSGIPDYFDEELMSDFEELWKTTPMYSLTSPQHFLPLFQHNPMKYKPGARFSYNNAGFIVLGLIVEKLTGMSFTDYVEQHIFQPCGMKDSGYFRMDRLPERTAIGYIGNDADWRTNIYSLPIVGGPDGGAYTTVHDLAAFWHALLDNRLLSESLTDTLLFPHVQDSGELHYGYGVWMIRREDETFKYFVMGYDPGVIMQSSYYPQLKAEAHILSNVESGADFIAAEVDERLGGE